MQNIDHLCMGCMSDNKGEQICPVCGFDPAVYGEENALALRTVLAGRYVVGKVVSSDGEGFTYLGFDTVTESAVRITEYFPAGLCGRLPGGAVDIHGATAFVFNEGIIQFIELNKTLGELNDISALYRVIDLFETNKTAYCVTEQLPGISLKEFLIRNGGILAWEQVRPLFLPLIGVFRTLHAKGIVHGGISPETLIVGRDGRVRVTGFCIPAIRNAKSEMTSRLFPGFAAIEQYRGSELTSATDVYGFAATMFRTLTGNPPPDSLQRLEHDNMTFPRSVAEQLPRGLLVAMANALQIEPEDRTANMDEFKADLQTAEEPDAAPEEKKEKSEKTPQSKAATRKYTLIASLATALILALIAGVIYLAAFRKQEGAPNSSMASLPSEVSVGDIGNSSMPESYYSVPDFSGSTLASLLSNEEYSKWFEFTVVKKEYNNKIAKGKVCAQSVAIGSAAKKDTKVELTISLGPSKVTVPKKLKGMTRTDAYITLLEMGFEPGNIEFIEKKDSTPTKEEVVIETSPAMGESMSPDEALIIYYNTNLIVDEPSSDMQGGMNGFAE